MSLRQISEIFTSVKDFRFRRNHIQHSVGKRDKKIVFVIGSALQHPFRVRGFRRGKIDAVEIGEKESDSGIFPGNGIHERPAALPCFRTGFLIGGAVFLRFVLELLFSLPVLLHVDGESFESRISGKAGQNGIIADEILPLAVVEPRAALPETGSKEIVRKLPELNFLQFLFRRFQPFITPAFLSRECIFIQNLLPPVRARTDDGIDFHPHSVERRPVLHCAHVFVKVIHIRRIPAQMNQFLSRFPPERFAHCIQGNAYGGKQQKSFHSHSSIFVLN